MSLYSTTQIARSGLVSFWQLAEPSGTTATDSGTGGNNGTYSGGFTLNQAGLLVPGGDANSSVKLNGTSGVVTVANAADLNYATGLTVEAVIQPSAIGSAMPIATKYTAGGLGWYLYIDAAGKLNAFANGTAGTETGSALTVGKTYHVAMTWNPNGDLFAWLNGASVSGFPGTSYTQNTSPVLIGSDAFSQFFNGFVQYVSVYNRVLSAGELATDAAIVALAFPNHRVEANLQLDGGLVDHRTPVADANYTVKATDRIVSYTSITAARTVTPAATGLTVGQRFMVKDESGSCSVTNTITWAGTTDGAASTPVLNSAYARAEVMWTGTAWARIG